MIKIQPFSTELTIVYNEVFTLFIQKPSKQLNLKLSLFVDIRALRIKFHNSLLHCTTRSTRRIKDFRALLCTIQGGI